MNEFELYTLSNGVRVVWVPSVCPISWVGVGINAGTRDELEGEWGVAHFVEHMLFKGTGRRRSWHINNRLESVGGQLDAYTTKEDTFVYATVATEHVGRALELVGDIVFDSVFPEREIERERDVVVDEIQSYNDSPAELIYDDFEQLLFPKDAIGRNILGSEESVGGIDGGMLREYVKRCYTCDEMVVFYCGALSFGAVVKGVEKHFGGRVSAKRGFERVGVGGYVPFNERKDMETHQAHSIIGSVVRIDSDVERMECLLLNNIVGGPNMSSLLNMAVRERNGLAYHVESGMTHYSDVSVWMAYFGCDVRNQAKAARLVLRVMEEMARKEVSESKLKMYKAQLRGQVLIGNQNRENAVLSLAKAFLHRDSVLSDNECLDIINGISASELRVCAEKVFDGGRVSRLSYR